MAAREVIVAPIGIGSVWVDGDDLLVEVTDCRQINEGTDWLVELDDGTESVFDVFIEQFGPATFP